MQEENTALKENVCSDDDRLAIIKRSVLILAESGQSLNPILSKGNKNIPSETKVQKASPPPLINLNLLDVVVAIFYFDFKQGILFIVYSTIVQEVTVKENVSSDDHRLAIIKGSQLIAKNTGQILNPFSSKRSGNLPSEAKVQKAIFLFY
jgi:hypothetical protein